MGPTLAESRTEEVVGDCEVADPGHRIVPITESFPLLRVLPLQAACITNAAKVVKTSASRGLGGSLYGILCYHSTSILSSASFDLFCNQLVLALRTTSFNPS